MSSFICTALCVSISVIIVSIRIANQNHFRRTPFNQEYVLKDIDVIHTKDPSNQTDVDLSHLLLISNKAPNSSEGVDHLNKEIKEMNSQSYDWKVDVLYPEFLGSVKYYQGSKERTKSLPVRFFNERVVSANLSLVSELPFEKLFHIKYLLEMWEGSLSLSLFIPSSLALEHVEESITSQQYPSRLSLCVYQSPSPYYDESIRYPINYLRNLAINNTETTHYMVIDMDLILPGFSLLPAFSTIVPSPNTVYVLPLFFLSPSSYRSDCVDNEECFSEVIHKMPSSKNSIKQFMQDKLVTIRSPSSSSHSYLHVDWFFQEHSSMSQPVSCFDSLPQQPFLILQHTSYAPLFDPRFVGSTYNRIQYVEHIRLLGYQFRILSHTYAFKLPSPTSLLDILHLANHNSEKRMKYLFIQWYNTVKANRLVNRTRICSIAEKKRRKAYIMKLIQV